MTTIDVNTGGFVGHRNLEENDFQDESGSGTSDRKAITFAEPRWHYHYRFH